MNKYNIIIFAIVVVSSIVLYFGDIFPFVITELSIWLFMLNILFSLFYLGYSISKRSWKNIAYIIIIYGLWVFVCMNLNIRIYPNSVFMPRILRLDTSSEKAAKDRKSYLWSYKIKTKSSFFEKSNIEFDEVFATYDYLSYTDTSNRSYVDKNECIIFVSLKNTENDKDYGKKWCFDNYFNLDYSRKFIFQKYHNLPPKEFTIYAFRLTQSETSYHMKDSIIGKIIFERCE